jgi:hypothetical protein
MKSKGKNYARLLEKVLNKVRKEHLESFYGEGTKIKIRSINFSHTKKECIVDAVIILGSIISEDVLEDVILHYEILDVAELYLDGYKVGIQVKFDV